MQLCAAHSASVGDKDPGAQAIESEVEGGINGAIQLNRACLKLFPVESVSRSVFPSFKAFYFGKASEPLVLREEELCFDRVTMYNSFVFLGW